MAVNLKPVIFNPILFKITQFHWVVTIFLENRTMDFDETLHVAWVCLPAGYGTSGRSGYSPVQKKGGLRPPLLASIGKAKMRLRYGSFFHFSAVCLQFFQKNCRLSNTLLLYQCRIRNA